MDEALNKIGLPVTCTSCGEKGFVKPKSDYDGWYRRKINSTKSKWYCPPHSKSIRKLVESINDKYKTPEPMVTAEEESENILDELDKLLED